MWHFNAMRDTTMALRSEIRGALGVITEWRTASQGGWERKQCWFVRRASVIWFC